MNKILLLAGMLTAFTACQKDEMSAPDAGATSSFTVSIPQSGVQSRAVTDDFGKGTSVNRCILEIYHGDQLYNRIVKPVSNKQVTFDNLRLVSSQEYDFVFWADCATANSSSDEGFDDKVYTTTATGGLKAITEKGEFVGNSDERDAFFYHEAISVNGSFTRDDIILKRPFGLLVVKTNDLNEIKDEALKPTGYTVAFKNMPNTFNALTGEISGSEDITYTAEELAKADGTISMDFLWAAEDEAALSDFSMTFLNNGTEICTNDAFTNIPIRRNYRTNVSGNLLTKQGTINVTIDPEFDENSPIEKVVVEVESAEDVKVALESGATDIIVKNLTNTAGNEIVIPKIYATDNDVKISLTLPETGEDVTIQYDGSASGTGSNTEAPAIIAITANTTGKTTINTPESTVILSGSFGEIDATTAANTLIVPEGVSVETLTVKGGNVEIYGTVGTISFEQGAGIVTTYAAGDAATLNKAVALVTEGKCARIVLTNDIDLAGNADNLWTPINAENDVFTEFDGGNHTIKNLYVDNYTGNTDSKGYYYGGLFYVLRGTVKDLTIDEATINCFRGGALAGRMDYGTVENCHVKNVKLTGYQKVGGLIGFVNGSSTNKNVTVSGCSVDGCTIDKHEEDEGLFQAGGLIGYLQSFDRDVLIENNSVKDISLLNVYTPDDDVEDKVYDLEQFYSHAFIGTIANFSNSPLASIVNSVELKNNTVAQQISGIPTCDRTDNYIGWWAGYYNSGKPYTPTVIVDGVKKDIWIEVKRVAALLKAGGNVTIYRDCDLTKCSETKAEIAIETPTVLELKANATLTVGKQQIVNKSELTVKGQGAMSATDYIFMNNSGATLTVENGTFTATKATDANGVVIYNQGVCNIKNGTFDGPGFTLMNTGRADMTIENGSVINRNSPTGYALMAAGGSAKLTVNGGRIEAIQSIGGANVTSNGGTILNDCKYYALYNEGGKTTINGGYFSGYPGMKDVYIAGGTVTIQGGYFEDNQTAVANGYVYKDNVQTVDGITYNYEVVAQ